MHKEIELITLSKLDVMEIKNAINKALVDINVCLEMQGDPEHPHDTPVQTRFGLITLRFSVMSSGTIRFIIMSDPYWIAKEFEFHYTRLRSLPGETTRFDSSQLRHERSTGGIFAIYRNLEDGANYYVTIN